MENSPPPVINKPRINEPSDKINKAEIKTKLSYNDINYDLEIGFSEDKTIIVFLIDEEKKLSSEYFSAKISLESFQKLSKYFRLCDSIDEVMGSLRSIDKNLKYTNEGYKISFSIRNDDAILKYSIPIYTEENLCFELLLQKNEKDKDLLIAKLRERIKELESGNFQKKKEKNEVEKEIREAFIKIKNEINKKELEVLKKLDEINKNSKFESLHFHCSDNLLKEINNISLDDNNYSFKWKTGPNYTLNENRMIATKTSGGEKHNCIILGDKSLPKNSIVSWKVK